MQRIIKAESLDELVNQVNILLARGATTTAENMAITPAGMGMAVAAGTWGGPFIRRGTDTVMALLELPPALVLELAAEEAARLQVIEDAKLAEQRKKDAAAQRIADQQAWRTKTRADFLEQAKQMPMLSLQYLDANAAVRLHKVGYTTLYDALVCSAFDLQCQRGLGLKHVVELERVVTRLQTTHPGARFAGDEKHIPLPPELQDPR